MNVARLGLDVTRNRMGKIPRPRWCTYLVCYHCNARCGMCDSWRMKRGHEMAPDEVHTVFGKIGKLDVVRLSGGEPFLREDFADVAAAVHAASKPGVMHITTNGSFPDRVANFVQGFAAPERLRFMVSFDGLAPEHDANRGADSTFATAIETVKWLAQCRQDNATAGVDVSVNHTVISAQSLQDHDELKRIFAPMGVDVHAVLAYEDSAMYSYKRQKQRADDLIPIQGYPLHPKLQGADAIGFTQRLLDEVALMRDPMLRIGKRYYLRGLIDRLNAVPDPQPRPPCVALRSHIRVLPDGSVPVCQFNNERVGNLLTQSLDDVWFAPQTLEQRAWVDACSGCWAECEVVPNALYTGDFVKEVVKESLKDTYNEVVLGR
jgi:MoaA/NifB/PqqE/SkfB family radical SAM enzyme